MSERAAGNEPHTYRDDMGTRRPQQQRPIQISKAIRRIEKKNETSKQDAPARQHDETEGRRHEDMTRRPLGNANKKNEMSKQDETRNETPHGTHARDEGRDDIGGTSASATDKGNQAHGEKKHQINTFIARPPHRLLPITRKPQIIPRPRAEGRAGEDNTAPPAPFQPAHSSHEWAIGQRHTKHDTRTGRGNGTR